MIREIFLLTLFAVAFIFNSAHGIERQIHDLDFESLMGSSGAPEGKVWDIIKGPDGFMWFATKEGLFRYDGLGSKIYVHSKTDPQSIINSEAIVVETDHDQRLWIGTFKGVSRYVSETDSFVNYRLDEIDVYSNVANRVNAIVFDRDGNLYTCSEAGFVYRYDVESDVFIKLNPSPFSMIKSMICDPKGLLWVGGEGELYRFDPKNRNTTRFVEGLANEQGTSANFINDILYVDDSEVWLATASKGTIRFNPQTRDSSVVEAVYTHEKYVHTVSSDTAGNIWITHNSGISIVEEESGKIHRYNPSYIQGMPSSGMIALYIDDQNNIWIGSEEHGLTISSNRKRFRTIKNFQMSDHLNKDPIVSSLMVDREQNLWVGFNAQGIDVLYKDGRDPLILRHTPGDSSTIGNQTVFTIFEDSRSSVWVGTYQGGLQLLDKTNNTFKTYFPDVADPSTIPGSDIRSIKEDENGRLWLVTHGQGVTLFDTIEETFVNYLHDPYNTENSLIDDWPFSLEYSHDRRVFVGSNIGMTILEPTTGVCKNYTAVKGDPSSFKDPNINQVFQDKKGRVWLATFDGLVLFDEEKGVKTYTVEQGMPHRIINSVVEDQQGLLWLGTKNGLARFDPRSEEIKTYSEDDGLVSNQFSRAAVDIDSSGILYFGQKKGITYFDPHEIVDNPYLPVVHITDFRLFNESVGISEKEHEGLNEHILKTEKIVLRHDQKVITFEFVALNFIQPEGVRYAYVLEGFESKWNYLDVRKDVNYTNLSPGTYVFKVKASNDDGRWQEIPRSIEIVILPPFWQKPIFRITGVLLAAFLLFFYIKWRTRSIRRQNLRLEQMVDDRTSALKSANEELEEKSDQIEIQNRELTSHRENLEGIVKERTRELVIAKDKAEHSDRLKSAFLANVSHEIRTPMNAIMGFIEILQMKNLSDEERDYYSQIVQQSGQTLISLIDDILDLSKIESNEIEVVIKEIDLCQVCSDLRNLFSNTIERESNGKVQFKFENTLSDSFTIESDLVRLKQIITNLISNASKFTESGHICMRLYTRSVSGEDYAVVEVEDTGIGIPDGDRKRIFDRFYKVKETGTKLYRGTGLGLTICSHLVARLGGRIEVDSEVGKGSVFRLILPVFKQSGVSVDHSVGNIQLEKSEIGEDPIKGLQGLSVLVAEDENPNFEYMRKLLEQYDIKIVRAENGKEALSLFHSQPFDVLLIDLKMPILDGYEVVKEVRKDNLNIPIIVQSAYAMRNDVEKCMEVGASDFLAKPFSSTSLLDKLKINVGV